MSWFPQAEWSVGGGGLRGGGGGLGFLGLGDVAAVARRPAGKVVIAARPAQPVRGRQSGL